MKLHIEYAGNGQTVIASESGPVAYMAPDLPEGVEEILAAAFAASPSLIAANREIYAAFILCNESRNRLTPFQSSEQFWIDEARGAMEKEASTAEGEGVPSGCPKCGSLDFAGSKVGIECRRCDWRQAIQ
jgi:primosomal protein N'